MNLKEALERRAIVRIPPSAAMAKEELAEASYDLKKAKKSLREGDIKWATVQAYYSMFHAARAFLFKNGYREKSHAAMLSVLEENGSFASPDVDDFRAALKAREQADYAHEYSTETAELIIGSAGGFLKKISKLV